METSVNYFTKEITISPTQEGSYILDLFQHFVPYESNKHQAWQIACHATYIQSVKGNRMEQEEHDATSKVGKEAKFLVTGMPLVMYCSHSFYSHKNVQGETKKEYYPLALLPMEKLPVAAKGSAVNGYMYDFSPRLNWIPFTPNGNDTARIWLQYPKTKEDEDRQATYMPLQEFMSKVLITVWLMFKKM